LTNFDTEHWHRSHPDARLAGVCAALAHALSVPLPAVRLAFVILTLFVHVAPLAYLALWLIIPRTPGRESGLEHLLRSGLDMLGAAQERRPYVRPDRE
jgi:phage shock protein PspC (stress-responsive transcriptional regulator)